MVPAVSDGIPPVPPYSGSRFASFPFRLQAFHLLRGAFPGASARFRIATFAALLPRPGLDPGGLGSSAFARHYSRNHSCSLLLPLLRCFSSRRSLRYRGARPSAARVSPFGHPRIKSHLRLPAAFRSLSRPSSPPRATGIPRAPFSFSFPHPRLPTGLLVFSVSRYVNELSRPPSPRRLSAPAAIPPEKDKEERPSISSTTKNFLWTFLRRGSRGFRNGSAKVQQNLISPSFCQTFFSFFGANKP